MTCPQCGGRSRVYDTERRPEGVMRRRICTSSRCAHKFHTLERCAPKPARKYAWPQ